MDDSALRWSALASLWWRSHRGTSSLALQTLLLAGAVAFRHDTAGSLIVVNHGLPVGLGLLIVSWSLLPVALFDRCTPDRLPVARSLVLPRAAWVIPWLAAIACVSLTLPGSIQRGAGGAGLCAVTSLALSCFAPVRTAIYLNFIAVSTILPTARYSPTLLPLWTSLIALLAAVAMYAWRGPFLKE